MEYAKYTHTLGFYEICLTVYENECNVITEQCRLTDPYSFFYLHFILIAMTLKESWPTLWPDISI
jgi:hypothetical protein